MCSVMEEDNTQMSDMTPDLKSDGSLNNKTCVKCGTPDCVISRAENSFCKSCFQVYVVHKFRAAIGKSKTIRDGEKVLVALSGGQHSSALLHLIQDGLSQRAHKKLRFSPILLHVDGSGIPDLAGDDKLPSYEKVAQLFSTSGYPSYFTALETALECKGNETSDDKHAGDGGYPLYWDPSEHLAHCSSPRVEALREQLKGVLNKLASVTSQEDFIHKLRLQLIACIAQKLGFKKVLTADCSSRLAVRILSDIAQGRGSQVALNTGFSDARRGDLMFLRPLRDLSSKELAVYNHLFKVDSAVPLSLSTKGDSLVSVERLSESFVMALQSGYFSTISNIVRTSEKLGLPDLTAAPKCWFCQSPLDTQASQSSALKAIEVSIQLSQGRRSQGHEEETGQGRCDVGGQAESGQCCGQGDGSCQSRPTQCLTMKDVESGLCYGCRLSLRDYKGDPDGLPNFITQTALVKKQRQKMRDEIADFLLEEEDEEAAS